MSLTEIGLGFARGLSSACARERLIAGLRRTSGLQHCWPVSSGRAAMTLILRAMKAAAADPQRDEVLIPAYTCYSVPASIARAGLRPRLCDIDPTTLGMDPDALDRCDFSRVVAVVSSNLYGIPNALTAIEAIARRRGVFMLDDAAQSLGARSAGRAAGAFGDAGLYSFDKGKIICTIQGGAIVGRAGDVAVQVAKLCDTIESSPLGETFANAAKLPIYALCLQPALYGIVRRLPFLGLGRTQYETRYPICALSDLQVGVAAELMQRLDALNEQRRSNAGHLARALADLPGISLPHVAADAQPVFARLPILVSDPAVRTRILSTLDHAGIGATGSYPLALADVPEVLAALRTAPDSIPGARQVAAQIVTLPTHGYCPPDLGERVRDLVSACLQTP